ncbi:hypothetical protein ACOJBM_41940 [Rhizobium beringeri]
MTQDSLKALFPSSIADAQPAALPVDVVAAPIVPSVDPKPEVLSSEPVSFFAASVAAGSRHPRRKPKR